MFGGGGGGGGGERERYVCYIPRQEYHKFSYTMPKSVRANMQTCGKLQELQGKLELHSYRQRKVTYFAVL